MFDMKKKMEFIESLAGAKADRFQGLLGDSISAGGDMLGSVMNNAESASTDTEGRAPAMILAETYEDIGEQLDSGDIEYGSRLRPGGGDISEALSSRPGVNDSTQPFPERPDSPFTERDEVTRSDASEMMRKKLNHFQIEKLAETLKQRLDAELKIQKERWGEEPQ